MRAGIAIPSLASSKLSRVRASSISTQTAASGARASHLPQHGQQLAEREGVELLDAVAG
jgi:hypothetical protein